MTDTYSDFTTGLESPANDAFEIVPDDALDLPVVTRALNVATEGQIRVTTNSGQTVTLFLVAGCAFPIRVRRVWATGTIASGIVGMY
ncbi:hypothetical protein L0666_16885 [Octadecabacter sp. CECT 8868]|uniref:spike base protein, RCAP_Rcc01079 family n=1 Tax=Octadecabacter algicola TaxID=2909342 RepID=UPI001F174330|nr:hypothetical protein [Octadecabacter algicola]MCF2906672.1 hypothetical protein [Octadecabacter algicola]